MACRNGGGLGYMESLYLLQLLVLLTFDPILKIPVLLPKFVFSNYDEFNISPHSTELLVSRLY